MDPIDLKSAPSKPKTKNWYNAKINTVTKDKSSRQRRKYIKQGKKDAARGVIQITEEAEIKSPFMNEQVQIANKQIQSIWESCDFDLKELKAYLDYQQEMFDKLVLDLPKLHSLAAQTENDIKNSPHEADAEMNEAVVNSRMERRIDNATQSMMASINTLKTKLEKIIQDCKQALADLKSRETLAESNEETVIHDLNEIAALYMQGTWKNYKAERFDAKPPKTTKEPRKRHYEYFVKYCFSIKERELHLLNKEKEFQKELGI